MIIDDDMTIRW